jgi:hypothetical protein
MTMITPFFIKSRLFVERFTPNFFETPVSWGAVLFLQGSPCILQTHYTFNIFCILSNSWIHVNIFSKYWMEEGLLKYSPH